MLPTKKELETVLPSESKGDRRIDYTDNKGEPDKQSKEILNLATNVVSTEKPEETAKKLPLERIEKFLDKLFI
ncbi:MAG: hypothetical protein F6K24_00550 [Okeania sp. SIO2D1]|nr:hypothetical protein [Okeania sp. SIO2D1]